MSTAKAVRHGRTVDGNVRDWEPGDEPWLAMDWATMTGAWLSHRGFSGHEKEWDEAQRIVGERNAQLHQRLDALERLARRIISKTPRSAKCPSCSREEDAPLRIVGYATRDDNARPDKVTHWTGCFVCNELRPLASEAAELLNTRGSK